MTNTMVTIITILALVAMMTSQPVVAEEEQHILDLQPNADLAAFATDDTIKLDVNKWCIPPDLSLRNAIAKKQEYDLCKEQFAYFKSLWLGINNQMTYVHVASQNRDNEMKQSNVWLQTRMTNFSSILSENIGKIADQNLVLNNQTFSKFNVVENRVSQMKDELDNFKKEFDSVKADLQKCKTTLTNVNQIPKSDVHDFIEAFVYNINIIVLCGIGGFCYYLMHPKTPDPAVTPAPAVTPVSAAPSAPAALSPPAALSTPAAPTAPAAESASAVAPAPAAESASAVAPAPADKTASVVTLVPAALPDPATVAAPADKSAPADKTASAPVPALMAVTSTTVKPVKKALSASGRLLSIAKACENSGWTRLAATVTCALTPAASVSVPDTEPTCGSVLDSNTKPTSGFVLDSNTEPTSGSVLDSNTKPTSGFVLDSNTKPTSGFVPVLETDSDLMLRNEDQSSWDSSRVLAVNEWEKEQSQTYEDEESFWSANWMHEGQIVSGFPKMNPENNLADHVQVFINYTCSDPSDPKRVAWNDFINTNAFNGECDRLGVNKDEIIQINRPPLTTL